ncbi:hypothetical protein ACH5RR_004710 [Cinchona calisaya]|uniref:CCHC-type domain-containing protein n=1 Tax=Cinchona calisaya TaxID=153742 RepID=A0ABD3AYD7_9GENT
MGSDVKASVHCSTKEVRRKLGLVFKKVLDVVIPPGGSKEGRHLRILVEVDLTKRLLRGTLVRMDGMLRWVEFRYVRCLDFCYICGIVGHGERNCSKKKEELDKDQIPQYGPWMRAKSTKNSPKKMMNQIRVLIDGPPKEEGRNNGKTAENRETSKALIVEPKEKGSVEGNILEDGQVKIGKEETTEVILMELCSDEKEVMDQLNSTENKEKDNLRVGKKGTTYGQVCNNIPTYLT